MRLKRVLILTVLSAAIIFACNKKSEVDYTLKGVDLSTLTDVQKEKVFELLKSFDCPCGCTKGDLVTCRNSDDENCQTSLKTAIIIKDKVKAGESDGDISGYVDIRLKRIAAKVKRKKEMYSKVYEIDTSGAHFLGKPDAKLTMIVFSDFDCPYCTKAYKIIDELAKEFSDELKVVYMHLPLNMHPGAAPKAIAAEAAGRQGKFFEMASLLFEEKGAYSDEYVIKLANKLELDIDKFKADLKSDELKQKVMSEKSEANRHQITATPTIILNKKMIKKKYNIDYFRKIVQDALGKAP